MEEETENIKSSNEVELTNFNISKHASERYAERIANCDNATDIHKYITLHSADIKKHINQMCTFGNKIYSGKLRDKPEADIYRKDNWIIIVDAKINNVITMYKVDLKLGEEFNTMFIDKSQERLDSAVELRNEAALEINSVVSSYEEIIKENTNMVNEYRSIINKLEEQSKAYKKVIETNSVKLKTFDIEINEIVDAMVCKKVF